MLYWNSKQPQSKEFITKIPVELIFLSAYLLGSGKYG